MLIANPYQTQLPQVHETVELTLGEMRAIVRGLAGQELPLEQVLAESRQECAQRCDAARVALDWPPLARGLERPVAYRVQRELQSSVRELLSNTLRHAQASRVSVRIVADDEQLQFIMSNDGAPFDGTSGKSGLGLAGLRRRVAELGGEVRFDAQTKGMRVQLRIPLAEPGIADA